MHATDATFGKLRSSRACRGTEMMTPRQRLEEIADILAGGFLRLRGRRGYVPVADDGARPAGGNTFPSSEELTGCPAAPAA